MRSHAIKVVLLVILLGPLLVSCTAQLRPDADSAAVTRSLGIEIAGLHLSAGNYMLDFRYKVVDPELAAPLIDHSLIPYLIHEASGAKFAVPAPTKVGPMRQMPRRLEAGKVYFVFFANPGKYVQRGDRVTIVHGPHRFEHLIVE